MKKLIFITTFLCGLASAQAGLLYNYSQLALRDLDEMNKLVQSKINESKKSGGDQTIPLKEALQAVYVRPNDDFMIDKVIQPLRIALEEQEAWEDSFRALVKEAIGALKNPKPFQPVVQVSYAIFLSNIVADFKPRIDKSFENSIITQIRDADIEVTKQAKNEHRMRVMRDTPSPSGIAEGALKAYKERLEREKKEAAEAAKNGKKVEKAAEPEEEMEELAK